MSACEHVPFDALLQHVGVRHERLLKEVHDLKLQLSKFQQRGNLVREIVSLDNAWSGPKERASLRSCSSEDSLLKLKLTGQWEVMDGPTRVESNVVGSDCCSNIDSNHAWLEGESSAEINVRKFSADMSNITLSSAEINVRNFSADMSNITLDKQSSAVIEERRLSADISNIKSNDLVDMSNIHGYVTSYGGVEKFADGGEVQVPTNDEKFLGDHGEKFLGDHTCTLGRSTTGLLKNMATREMQGLSTGFSAGRSTTGPKNAELSGEMKNLPDNGCGSAALEAREVKSDKNLKKILEECRATSNIVMMMHTKQSTQTDRCVLSPVRKVRFVWDALSMFFIFVDLWATTFELIFLGDVPSPFLSLTIFMTVWWLTDILLNFNTGFVSRDGLVMNRKKIFAHYMSYWFWIDITCSIPYDLVVTVGANTFNPNSLSMMRISRVLKVLKTVKFARMGKALTWVQHMRYRSFMVFSTRGTMLMIGLKFLVFAILASHFQACINEIVRGAGNADDFDEAFDHYLAEFRDCFYFWTTVTSRYYPSWRNREHFTLLFFCWFRSCVVFWFAGWLISKAFILYQEEMKLNRLQSSLMQYIADNCLSAETQIQIISVLVETKNAQIMQRHVKELMSENIPDQLRKTVCQELWTEHLLTFDLFVTIKDWHEDLLSELAALVREEVYPSKTILLKEGTVADAAYYVLRGKLTALNCTCARTMPDFTKGMWVGELALLQPAKRSRNTTVTRESTRLMKVYSARFHKLIENLGLGDRWQPLQANIAEQGLCGRCGQMCDHFTHACPLWMTRRLKEGRISTFWEHVAYLLVPMRIRRNLAQASAGPARRQTPDLFPDDEGAGNLDKFLRAHGLSSLGRLLKEQKIGDTRDLPFMDMDALVEGAADDPEELTQVMTLGALMLENLEDDLASDAEMNGHLLFLSHYKKEAGTEAALMRNELEEAMKSDDRSWGKYFKVPSFLDSEDLSDLAELTSRVCSSHNLVLLLTKNVLKRPWVLVEIVTAVRNRVNIIPVTVVKTEAEFVYPNEKFYSEFQGKFLGKSQVSFLNEQGIQLEEVEQAIRQVFQRIALPYSPHRPASIRNAEVRTVLKQLKLKDGAKLSLIKSGMTRSTGNGSRRGRGNRSVERSASIF